MTIAERMKRSKGVGTAQNEELGVIATQQRRVPKDVVLVGIAALIASGSFGLGVVAGRDAGAGESGGKVVIEKPFVAENAPATVGAIPEVEKSIEAKRASASASGGQYVASKTGTKYYLPWCGSAKRIKKENKVWFSSKGEAEAAGYEPAKNCKGL